MDLELKRTMLELEAYITEVYSLMPPEEPDKSESDGDEAGKEKEKDISQSIPIHDAIHKPVFDDEGNLVVDVEAKVEGEDEEEKEEKPGEEPGTGLSGPVPDSSVGPAKVLPRFQPYEATKPAIGLKTVEKALEAIQRLEKLEEQYKPFLVCYIDDKGVKKLHKAFTHEEAVEYIESEMKKYQEKIDANDSNRESIIDEGNTTSRLYEPTPKEYLNDDESFKGPAAALGKLHTFYGEEHFIVYDELSGSTARWDIFNLEEAKDIVVSDGEQGYTVTEEDRKKYRHQPAAKKGRRK